MIKFFRHIRMDLMKTDNTDKPKLAASKYFKYAVGEIILVVIGILIAVSINTWNENRQKEKQLDSIYGTVAKNLKTDLEAIKAPIDFYESLDSALTSLLTTSYSTKFLDSINETNYEECRPCSSMINRYETFEIQDVGIELLKKHDDNEITEGNALSQEIIQFYKEKQPRLIDILDILKQEAYRNLKSYEQFPWYSDYSLGIYSPESVAYFLQNQTYKNKAANFKILIGRNYLRRLKDYEDNAKELISKIENR